MNPANGTTWPQNLQPVRRAALVGAAGLGLCLIGAFIDPAAATRAYLVAFLFWVALPVGALGILLIHSMTGGRWGAALQSFLEAAVETLPLLALLFLPIALGMQHLYPWADPDIVVHDALLKKKALYLNAPFFLVRAALCFVVWIGVGFAINRWSSTRHAPYDEDRARRRQTFAGPALVLVGLTVTVAAIDWLMSLEPHWFSSIFGMLIAASQVLPAFAFGIAVLAYLTPRTGLARVMTADIWNDLGNLLLAFVLIWTYLAYSQFFLIWSGNLPEEIAWYRSRMEGGWELAGWMLILVYFAFPFALLLSRDVKRNPKKLSVAAAAVLFMHLVFQGWLVVPAFSGHGSHDAAGTHPNKLAPAGLSWLDLPAWVGIGGVWLAWFGWRLRAWPLWPAGEPDLQPEAHGVKPQCEAS